jgi:hypothetical protein
MCPQAHRTFSFWRGAVNSGALRLQSFSMNGPLIVS